MTSFDGFFVNPQKGIVEAKDFEPTFECGHGLHGLPWGAGNVCYFNYPDGIWQVLKVDTEAVPGRGI